MTNGYKTLIIILVISIILILSGCVNKSKENNIIRVPGNNTSQIRDNYTEQILDNDTIKINDIINIIIPEKSSTYDDNKFVKIVEEANNIIDNNNMRLIAAAEKGNFEDIEKYGKNLEVNTTKYMSILKSLTISPRFEKMYSEYYNYLENMKNTGQHIQESAKQHKLIDTGSCNNPSSYNEQM
jgi:hypothetical protein